MAKKVKYVSTVVFDCVINGVEYKNVVLDFKLDVERETDTLTEAYELTEEDGPWSMKKLGDTMYDFQVFGQVDENERGEWVFNGQYGMSCMVMEYDENEKAYYHIGDAYEFDFSNIRIKYYKPSQLVSRKDIDFKRICTPNNFDLNDDFYVYDDSIFYSNPDFCEKDAEHYMCWYFANGRAVSEDKRLYMTYPKYSELSKADKNYVCQNRYAGYWHGERIDNRTIALAFGDVKIIVD